MKGKLPANPPSEMCRAKHPGRLYCILCLLLFLAASPGRAQTTNVWTDNFESPTVWDNWSVDNGVWEIGAPLTGPATNSAGYRTHEGTNCAATVLAGNYPASTSSRLIRTLPFVVPSAAQNPRLQFWQWYQFSGNSYGVVQIKYGTNAWIDLSPRYYATGSGVWTRPVVDLSAYAGKAVQIAFQIVTDGNVADGWDVDQVSVVKGPYTVGFTNGAVESFEQGIGDWYAETGTWEVGVPTYGLPTNAAGSMAHSGTNCLATVLGGNYEEDRSSRFISPPFVMPGADQNPRLRFWSWYNIGAHDFCEMQIKVGTNAWQALHRYTSTGSGVWNQQGFDLSAYAGQTVQLGFYFESHSYYQYGSYASSVGPGWYVDEVAVVTGSIQTLQPNITEGFESGWKDWYAEDGTWEIGQPTSGPGGAHNGTNCAATVLGSNYAEDTIGRLVSPPFVMPAVGAHPNLRFWHWFGIGAHDFCEVQIKVAGGSWQALSHYSPGSSGAWSRPSIDLSAYAGQTVQLGFYLESHSYYQYGGYASSVGPGWYVDEVMITSVTPPTGIVQFTDARYFVNEGETNAVISMERKDGSSGAVDVTFVATDGTAAGGVDFDSVVDTIHWNDGEQGVKTDIVPIHQVSSSVGNKTVLLQLAVPGALASSVAREDATLVIIDNSGPQPLATNIAYLRSLVGTTNYITTNTTALFTLDGTVTTYANLSTTAADELFFMQDNMNGIAVLFRGGTNQFMPQAGDRVRVTATLTNINGLLALAPDNANITNVVWRLSSGNALPAPAALDFAAKTNVTTMEAMEANYVSAAQVWIDQAGGNTFPTTLTNIVVTNQAGATFDLTINPNSDIGGKPKPTGKVTLLGVLTQNDPAAPYTTNYALLPTRYADIVNSNAILSFATATIWVSESGPAATLSVTRDNNSSDVVTATFATVNGTAVAGADYVATNGVLTWGAGDMTPKTITVGLLDDSIQEPDKTFAVALSAPTGGAGLSSAMAIVNVVNDDYTIQPASQTNAPHSTAMFAITPAASVAAMQWFKNSTAIPGATGPVLYFGNVSPTNAGSYTVAITNIVGTVVTPAATLLVPPWAGIISPAEGTTYTAPTNISISAEAYDPDGLISQVQLLAGTNRLATLTSAPYSYVWTNPPVASQALKAVATGHAGLGITSAPVNIVVQTALPQIALAAPTNGTTLTSPASVVISAVASDADNSIAQVDLYYQTNGSPIFLTSLTNLPYLYNWTHMAPGHYQLTARAVDRYGPVAVSAPVTVNILQPAVFQFSTNQYFVNESNGTVKVAVLNSGDLPGVISYQTTNGTAQGGTGFSGDYTIAANSLALNGHQSTNVSIQIIDNYLNGEDIFFQVQLLAPGLGAMLGSPDTTTVTIHLNDTSTNSLPTNAIPASQQPPSGALMVVMTPPEANGQWRLPWEQSWRTNGVTISNLLAGAYTIEFRNTPGYLAYPPSLSVSVTNGGLTQVTNLYYLTAAIPGHLDPGSLTVGTGTNSPARTNATVQSSLPAGASWRFIGESGWRNPGSTATNLTPDTYFVEFAPVSGWTKPASQAVQILSGANLELIGTYLLPQVTPASVLATINLPVPAAQLTNYANYPFGFAGQLQTDNGYGSGVAVRPNVVLTAAHMVFNDRTLAFVNQAYWSLQHDTNAVQPPPLPARGWYVLSGYAERRTNDVGSGLYGPGASSPQSRNLDVAALYFLTPAARNGFGGYLSSDASPNPYLAGSDLKMLAGYPLDGTLFGDASIVAGQMYKTPPRSDPFSLATDQVTDQRVYLAPWLLGYPGSSGGPLYVQAGGYYYPAAVYLGTVYSGDQPYATAVRAIDSAVTRLINLAASGGDSGTNNNGGGVITVTTSHAIGSLAFLQVKLGPPETLAAGGGFRIASTNANAPYNSQTNFTAVFTNESPVTIQFSPIPHWDKPPDQTATLTLGQITVINANYTPTPAQLDVKPAGGLTFSGAVHGPFMPVTQTYAITNTGDGTLTWNISADQNWVTISPTNGQGAATVNVTINTNANSFSNGIYNCSLAIGGNGGGTIRPVQLNVTNSPPATCTITLAASPASAGTVVGGGTFAYGSLKTVTANVNAGFGFINWTRDGTVVTNSAGYTFKLTEDLSLVANFTDTNNPTLSITNLTAGQRVSNAGFTVKGKASDNWMVSNVWCQLNNNGWTNATSGNGWTNWAAGVTLWPGTNTVQAFAMDNAGNRSATNSVSFQFVATNRLQLQMTGLGTISPNYSNAWLEIGRNYSITSTPASGFVFTNWVVSTNWIGGTITSKTNLQFMMASNLTLQANFVDVARPTNTITAPTAGQRWSNSMFTVTGTAKDNVGVTNVFYQLNGSAWTNATSGNGWTNWSAGVTLWPGTNTVQAFAVDNTGNRSITNAVSFVHVVSAPLQVQVNGQGTLTPNYNNALLAVGQNYSMMAAGTNGYAFTNWITSTNWTGSVVSNSAALNFVMQSNLTLQANFIDTNKPTLIITNLAAGQRISNAEFTVKGKASDNGQMSNVVYQLNGGAWSNAVPANNWTNWSADLVLVPGTNQLAAYAVDTTGNRSATTNLSFQFVVTNQLQLSITGKGTISPNYSNAWLEIGRNYSITSSPAAGFRLTNWTGSLTTNTAALNFTMASNLAFTANFIDTNRPTLNITNLVAGQRISNAMFTVKGSATDNWQVASVQYQLNGGIWTNATGTTNWMAPANLLRGTNQFAAYAVDIAGNNSLTNTLNFQYVVTNQVQLSITGKGTISPNYSNAWLEIGRNYSITSSPAAGFRFTNWTGSLTTNTAAMNFTMASNLAFTANFIDTNRPTLTITAPTAGQKMTNAMANVVGTASDNWKVTGVWYQLNSNAWNLASTTTNNYTNWATTVTLLAGTNTVKAYALDLGGNISATSSVSFVSSNTFNLQLTFTNAQPMKTNGLTFSLQLSTGLNGHIQVSTNLVNWATLTNFVGSNSTITFRDPAATNSVQRFYRAVIP